MELECGVQIEHAKISKRQATMNLCRALVGTGILSLPLALQEAGLWAGAVLIFIMGYCNFLSCHKIVSCSQELSQRHSKTSLDYGQVSELAFETSFSSVRKFGKFFKFFTNFSLLLMQFGICSVYTVFMKEHLEEIWHRFSDSRPTEWVFFGVVVLALCAFAFIRQIKFISTVSLIGNVVMLVTLVIVAQELLRPPLSISGLPAITGVTGIIYAAGNILYAFESQALILPLENKMRNGREMFGLSGVLFLSCLTATIAYVFIGFFGYAKYGDAVRGAITLNMPDTILFLVVRIMLVVVVYCTYLVQQFIIVDMSWPKIAALLHSSKSLVRYAFILEFFFKILLVLIAFAFAAWVPNLGKITSLVGVTAGNFLGMIIPPCIHAATFLPGWLEERNSAKLLLNMASNVVILAAGLFFMITGLVSALR